MTNAATPSRRSIGTASGTSSGAGAGSSSSGPSSYAEAAGTPSPPVAPAPSSPVPPVPSRAGLPAYLTAVPTAHGVNLPTKWNDKDKCSLLGIGGGGLVVTYNGSGKNDMDAAAVRANFPLHPAVGVAYFEITIVSKGRDGYIGIGLSHAGVNTNRLPGWEQGSWGYHGDDGNSFACYGTGKPYGPTFTTGDVIGCGVNFAEGNWEAFFTKNGENLGVAFRDLRVDAEPVKNGSVSPLGKLLYPSVGLRTPGEVVEANFGQQPFVFDIAAHLKSVKGRVWSHIQSVPLPVPAPVSDSEVRAARHPLDELVLSYMIHQGYVGAAEAFARSLPGSESDAEMRDAVGGLARESWVASSLGGGEARNRQEIRDRILEGDLDRATEIIARLYPAALLRTFPANDPRAPPLSFYLKIRRFVDFVGMMSRPSDGELLRTPVKGKRSRDDPMILATPGRGEEDDDAMEVDSLGPAPGSQRNRRKNGAGGMAGTGKKARHQDSDELLRQIMACGQEMQNEYGASDSELVRGALQECFSLLAYVDPYSSPLSHLLDSTAREPVANMVNSAILAAQGKPALPALEVVYRQTAVVLDELASLGAAKAPLVNLSKDCLIP